MIKSISSNSPLVFINSGHSSTPYINMNAPSSGMIRFNGNSQCFEVFDGGSNVWHQMLGSNATLDVSGDLTAVVSWAKERMQKEEQWKKLANSSQAVQLALDAYEQARRNLEITAHLAKDTNVKTD